MNVKEITKLTKINRSTFYFYYQNSAEILKELIEWLKDEIVSIYSSRKRYEGNFNEFYKEMYENFNFKKNTLFHLLVNQGILNLHYDIETIKERCLIFITDKNKNN